MNKHGINDKTYHSLLGVFESEPELKSVRLFGSRARGDFKAVSDIDLVVELSNPDTIWSLYEAIDEIDTLLKIDIIDINSISNRNFLSNINRDSAILFSQDKNKLEKVRNADRYK
jgi:predicted nucleotidyltransferase